VAVTGAALSLAGVLMQAVTRNPLAEPYILGVSSGASAGAVSAIVWGWFSLFGGAHVYFGALIGSCLATIFVVLLQAGSANPVRLLLVGIGVSAFFQAVTTLIIYSSSNEAQVRSAMFWTVGSFSGVAWADLPTPLITLSGLMIFSILMNRELDLLLLGQSSANQMGLNVKRFQLVVVLAASLSIAVVVAKVGVIGFVGLIIPHMARRLVRARHGSLSPVSALLGAVFLIITDTVSRTAFAPQEIPIGVITALAGAPVFIVMVQGMRYGSTP
jgi:iron complex transport system permease protein